MDDEGREAGEWERRGFEGESEGEGDLCVSTSTTVSLSVPVSAAAFLLAVVFP